MSEQRFSVSSLVAGRPVVMGILNCTPDSFSDGAKLGVSERVAIALEMVENGATIIDVGGESTRPGAEFVSLAEELERVVPVVEALRRESNVAISLDTNKAAVAEAGLEAGADIINDITALRGTGDMAAVAVKYKAPVILMHMQGMPRDMQKDPQYGDVVSEVLGFLCERAEYAESRGVFRGNIIFDPGFGFGKTFNHNREMFAGLQKFADAGYPVLVGVSRKSMIGQALGLEVDQRLEASLSMAVLAAERGAAILRVHDVLETVRAVKMREALLC